jgi:hypothetical protein
MRARQSQRNVWLASVFRKRHCIPPQWGRRPVAGWSLRSGYDDRRAAPHTSGNTTPGHCRCLSSRRGRWGFSCTTKWHASRCSAPPDTSLRLTHRDATDPPPRYVRRRDLADGHGREHRREILQSNPVGTDMSCIGDEAALIVVDAARNNAKLTFAIMSGTMVVACLCCCLRAAHQRAAASVLKSWVTRSVHQLAEEQIAGFSAKLEAAALSRCRDVCNSANDDFSSWADKRRLDERTAPCSRAVAPLRCIFQVRLFRRCVEKRVLSHD